MLARLRGLADRALPHPGLRPHRPMSGRRTAGPRAPPAAPAIARHRLPAQSASGKRMPNCGLKVRQPTNMPASSGRRSRARSAAPVSDAVKKPLCAASRFQAVKKRSERQRNRRPPPDDQIDRREAKGQGQQVPADEGGLVGQQRQRRQDQKIGRRIGPIRIVVARSREQRCLRLGQRGRVVEGRGMALQRRGARRPAIAEVVKIGCPCRSAIQVPAR